MDSVKVQEFKTRYITIRVVPTFWQRVKFLFSSCMILQGDLEESSVPNKMEITFK